MQDPTQKKKYQYREPKTSRYAAFPSQTPKPDRKNDDDIADAEKESHLSNLANSPASEAEGDPPLINPVVKEEAETQTVLQGSTERRTDNLENFLNYHSIDCLIFSMFSFKRFFGNVPTRCIASRA